MKRCAIVDDEPLAIDLLSSYIDRCNDLELVNSFDNPIEFLRFEKENTIDIVFLDINMPELSGIQVAKIINQSCEIIFTTAHPDYAVEGFELRALDYLVKPISFERFTKSVERVENSADTRRTQKKLDTLYIKVEHRLQKVNLDEILYLKGMGDYVQIVTSDNKWMTLENLKSFESSLDTSDFARIHKSYIIALSKIDFIRNGKVSIDQNLIPIGKTYESAFFKNIHLKK